LTAEKNALNGGIPEHEAISGARMGDPACFESLYHLHKRHVYTLCLRITRNTSDAEDLTQEVFLQLFRKVATFRGDSAFSTWLHRVAMNVVLMHLRKRTLPLAPEPLDAQLDGTAKKEIATTDQRLSVAVDRIVIERSVGRLPTGYRTVFLLHDVQGYEHKEIARMMRCSIGNSKSQLHKARLKLRSHIDVGRSPRSAPRTWQPDAAAA